MAVVVWLCVELLSELITDLHWRRWLNHMYWGIHLPTVWHQCYVVTISVTVDYHMRITKLQIGCSAVIVEVMQWCT